MKDLSKVKEALAEYESCKWNSYAGDYDYEEVLDFFSIDVEDGKEWEVDSDGNIWFPPAEDERPNSQNQYPFFNILVNEEEED